MSWCWSIAGGADASVCKSLALCTSSPSYKTYPVPAHVHAWRLEAVEMLLEKEARVVLAVGSRPGHTMTTRDALGPATLVLATHRIRVPSGCRVCTCLQCAQAAESSAHTCTLNRMSTTLPNISGHLIACPIQHVRGCHC
jgi:hypothetical protein